MAQAPPNRSSAICARRSTDIAIGNSLDKHGPPRVLGGPAPQQGRRDPAPGVPDASGSPVPAQPADKSQTAVNLAEGSGLNTLREWIGVLLRSVGITKDRVFARRAALLIAAFALLFPAIAALVLFMGCSLIPRHRNSSRPPVWSATGAGSGAARRADTGFREWDRVPNCLPAGLTVFLDANAGMKALFRILARLEGRKGAASSNADSLLYSWCDRIYKTSAERHRGGAVPPVMSWP